MTDFFPPDQESIAVVQIFQESWGDDDFETLIRVYGFQEPDALQQTNSLAMIDPFLAYLTADLDLHPGIRDLFQPEEKRNVPCVWKGKSMPLWREVERPEEARVNVINLLDGYGFFKQAIRETLSETVVRLAEAFLNLFAPDGQFLASFIPGLEIQKWGGLAAFTDGIALGDGAIFNASLTCADLQGCIIGISRKNHRMGIVLANNWSG